MAGLFRHILKLRYWLATGAVGGSLALNGWYEDWKNKLPTFEFPEWVKQYNIDEISPRFGSLSSIVNVREWTEPFAKLKERWGSMDASEEGPFTDIFGGQQFNLLTSVGSSEPAVTNVEPAAFTVTSVVESPKLNLLSKFTEKFSSVKDTKEKPLSEMDEMERIQKLQDELLKTQMQYQRELEQLEQENKVLKQKLLLKDTGEQKRIKKLRRSLIDMYSEMLDMLTNYDSSYGTTDNLPRVVVVGDQSAGKTSVLEMIAQARMFPRGSGEMMTRSPVKVTLSEGPYHVAQFRNSDREFDLTREDHLAQLRAEIELRMRNSVKGGQTVSKEEIALTVKGPSLPRMVLVDLPGVISTVTTEMARETKDDIFKICKQYMENPNAIILCIQDGSVDAERSNVTDLVSTMDPRGQRTILVLTKVDLAEKNLSNPDRIKKILEGKLFPMKALGYFGVVTGKGVDNSSIDEIRKYEEEFFGNSKLFRDGVLKATQMTTRNMSMAVSDCFWRMVRESIEAQADGFRALRFNLETEWKNTFVRRRELSRDELFDKARGEILDEIVNLSLVNSSDWEGSLRAALWSALMVPAFDNILIPACNNDNAGTFNTHVDINLKHWVEKELALQSIQVGWETLSRMFQKQVEEGTNHFARNHSNEHEELLKPLKKAVVESTLADHKWDSKALDYLRVIQLNAIDDRIVPDPKAWQEACEFMASAVLERRDEVTESLKTAAGNKGWFRRSVTPEQTLNAAIQGELTRLLSHNPEHKQDLSNDDFTVIRSGLSGQKDQFVIELTNDRIRQQWDLVYKQHLLDRLYRASGECKYLYQNYRQGTFGVLSEGQHNTGGQTSTNGANNDLIDCQAVTFFYRLNRLLTLSTNALRQQIVNTEQRRMEKEVKNVLDDWAQDLDKKRQYLTGRQVELAEELAQVRHIQEKLEEFIVQLHQEKS